MQATHASSKTYFALTQSPCHVRRMKQQKQHSLLTLQSLQLRGIPDPLLHHKEGLHSPPKIRLPLIQTPSKENHWQKNHGQHAYQRMTTAAPSPATCTTETSLCPALERQAKKMRGRGKSRKVARSCSKAGNKRISKTRAKSHCHYLHHCAAGTGKRFALQEGSWYDTLMPGTFPIF